MRTTLLLVLIAGAGVPFLAQAAPIYRCTDAKGATVYSQVPCGKDATQMGASSNTKGSNAAANATHHKEMLSQIDARCDAESDKIRDSYTARFAKANAEIAALHKKVIAAGNGADGDPGLAGQIHTLEAGKTELLGSQDRELSALQRKCDAERTAEVKRQADRDAARPMAKR
jgi:hypothetical protein